MIRARGGRSFPVLQRGGPDASSSEDTDELSDDSDDSSDSSDDSTSSSSESAAVPYVSVPDCSVLTVSYSNVLLGCSGSNKNRSRGRKRAATSNDEDAAAPLPEPTDFDLLEVRLGIATCLPTKILALQCMHAAHRHRVVRLPVSLLQETELARVDCLVSPLYRKRKLMNNAEAKELLGMCISECKRQAVDTAKQSVRPMYCSVLCAA